jgi:CRP-like cAMP-binding protein
LDGLSDSQRKDEAQLCSCRHYSNNEQIIDRQSDATDILFTVEGRVWVVNYSLSGREVTFNDLGAGQHFGELSVIDGEHRSARIIALTNCNITSIPQDRFLNLLEKEPQISLQLMRGLTSMARASTLRIMDLSTLAANNRIYADLLRLAKIEVDDDGRAVISPTPLHVDIASRVSTPHETVALVLKDLARKGLIVREKSAFIINDLGSLQEMVEKVRSD